MKDLRAIAVLIFCLGLLVGNTYAQDGQDLAVFGDAGTPIAAAAGVPIDSSTGFEAAGFTSESSGFAAADAGYPTAASGFAAADAGYPTAASGFAAAAGVPTGSPEAAMYTTYAPPATQQNVPLTYDVAASPPAAVFYGGSYIPYTTFALGLPKTPQFWVLTRKGWGVYATCPLGGWARYLMYVPYTGSLKMYELYPDTTVRFYNYGWATRGYKYLWFIGDMPGRHISFITVTDRPSNYVTIDVF
jgi:hypothetical protein